LIGRKIASVPRVVLGTPEYLDRAGVPKMPGDLITHNAVIYTSDRDGGGSWVFRQDGSEIIVTLSGRLRLSSSEGVRAAVLSSLGLAVVSKWLFKPELACGTVRTVLTDWTLPEIELWLVFPMGRRANAKARAFADFVQNEIEEHHAEQE
jgi:DNA-binding transcriptional LysR family regulator